MPGQLLFAGSENDCIVKGLRTHTLECLNEATDTCIALGLFSRGLSRSLEGGMHLGKRKGLLAWQARCGGTPLIPGIRRQRQVDRCGLGLAWLELHSETCNSG